MKLIPRAILRGPVSVVHFLTNNCNARCTHCFIDFDDPQTFKGDLSVEEIDRVTRTVGWQLRNVNLTGGEPFLHKDIFEIARCYLENTGVRSIYITSNGYFTDRTQDLIERYLAERYERGHALFVSISIDDYPDAHDQNRKIKGLFQRAMQTLRMLDSYRGWRIHAVANLTVIPANYQRIGEIYDYLVEKEGIGSFTTVIMRDEGVARIDSSLRADLSAAYRNLNQRIKRDLLSGRIRGFEGTGVGELANAKNVVMRNQIERAFESGEFISTCYAGETSLILEANGNVRPCEVLPTVIGNVRASGYDLGAVWKSGEALKARRDIVDTDCHCTYECAWSMNTLVDASYYPQLFSTLIHLKSRKAAT